MPPKKRKAAALKKTAEEKEAEKKARAEAKGKKEAERAAERDRKKAEKERREAEEAAREEAELSSRAIRVVAVLESVDQKTDAINQNNNTNNNNKSEAIFKGQDSGFASSHTAPRALLNAVECQDLERAKKIMESCRYLVDSNDKRVTDPQKIKTFEQNSTAASDLEGFNWKLPFCCPVSKTEGTNINALSIALRNGQLDMLDLLIHYFGWTPVLGNENQETNYRGRASSDSHQCLHELVGSTELPAVSFDKLLEKEIFELCLPHLTVRAMRYGRITFVRRALRFYLRLDYMNLSRQSFQCKKEVSSETLGVTMLHLAALESNCIGDLNGLKLDKVTTNAPALHQFVTPLHLAALSGNLEVYRELEKAGGDWTIPTNDSLHPISYAAAAPSPPLSENAATESESQDHKQENERKKKRHKNDSEQKENDTKEKEEEEGESPIDKFQRIVRPSATFRYMTSRGELREDLQHEFDYHIGSRRSILETAIRAVRHHNIVWIIHWFDDSESTKWYPYNGELSILQQVIQAGDEEMLSLFLSQPKFQAIFLSEGMELISSIVDKSQVGMLRLVLEEWKYMEEKNKVTLECTPVHLQASIRHESFSMVRSLLGEGKVDVNSPEVPMSALHVACELDFVECAALLLDNGANPRAETSDDGVSVMQHACRSASIASVELLLKRGISLDLKSEVETKKKQDEEEMAKKKTLGKDDTIENMETEQQSPFEGWYMVLTGIFSVSKEVIKNVIESQGGKVQAQVNGKTTHCVYSGRDGYNDYGLKMGKGDKKYTAAKKKRLPFLDENDILRYLKRTGQAIASHETSGNLSTETRGHKGHDEASFLHDVIKNCSNKSNVPSVQTLLDHGADRMVLDDFGRSPLHYAVLYLAESDSNMELLLILQDPKKQLLVNQYDKTGLTPLLQACISEKWKFAEILLEHVEDVNLFVGEPQMEENNNVKKEVTETDETHEEDGLEDGKPKAPKFQNMYSGWSLGHLLLVHHKISLLKKFFALGGNVNTRMRTPDSTPLVLVSIINPDICRELLTCPKCNVNATNSKGQTLLHAIFVRLSVGRILTKEERNDFNKRSMVLPFVVDICPPSNEASIIHLTNIWRWNAKLDASIVDRTGAGVFHVACASEDTTSCIRAFLNRSEKNAVLHKQDGIGNSPLALALLNHKLHIVLFLMDQGADINGHVYWHCTKQDGENQDQQAVESPSRRRRRQHLIRQYSLRFEDGEAADGDIRRMSIYAYVMKNNMPADIIYNILRMPSCDMSTALQASVATGNLKWTEQLIRSVDVQSPNDAGKFVRLLFSSTLDPGPDKQGKILELSRRLVRNAGGVILDINESTGYNIIHTMIGECRISSSVLIGMLQLIGTEKSIGALLATEKREGQTALHMAVVDNRFDMAKLILSYVKEHGAETDIVQLLEIKDFHKKTALHYAVGANSEGTYLNGSLLSLLVRFGSKVTIPDGDGKTVASMIGQMPRNHLEHFKLALVGHGKGDTKESATMKLPREALAQIEAAQIKRESQMFERSKKEENDRTEYAEKWKSLQKQWEEFRAKRLSAKSTIFEDTRQKAIAGSLIIPLDRACRDPHAYRVYIGGKGDVYDALLVSSDLRDNFFGSNSFYALQLVELTEAYKKERVGNAVALANAQQNEAMLAYRLGMAKYRVIERWGRIGEWDFKSRARGFTQLTKAMEYFETAFLDKTKNEFSERENFEAARGSYNWVQKAYDECATKEENDTKWKSDGTFHPSVETFFRAITSLTRVRQELREKGFGVDCFPLGQLSPNTISEAHKILRNVEKLLVELESIDELRGRALRENKKESYKIRSELTDLSNQFYMTIPHDFGSSSSGRFIRPAVINDRPTLKKKLNMLLSLEDVENSINILLSVSPKDGIHQRLNDIYNLVGCDLRFVPPETDEFKLVEQYAIAGSGGGGVKIAHLLEVTRYEDAIRFEQYKSDRGVNDQNGHPKNRLLWHGSRMSNILGIFMKGLKIAPPESPAAGYNFGKGIYLADVFDKSAAYSSSRSGYRHHHSRNSSTSDIDKYKVMLLCEVALGEPCKLRNPNSSLTGPPEGYDSVQCVGRVAPSSAGMFLTKDGVGVPLGEVETTSGANTMMHHNEFIVYDECRVRIKYAMLFE